MSIVYAAVTSKGQVTLPAQLRKQLGITPGQKIGFRIENNRATIEVSPDFETVRNRLETIARKNGTWGAQLSLDEMRSKGAMDRYANSIA